MGLFRPAVIPGTFIIGTDPRDELFVCKLCREVLWGVGLGRQDGLGLGKRRKLSGRDFDL